MDWRDRIIKLMAERGFKTRNDLCMAAGISAGSLNMALNGTHELKLSTMGKLANALDTTTRWLLYGDEMVEARQVPLLKNALHVWNYMTTGVLPDSCRYVQIVHDLTITNRAFAWLNRDGDMEPDLLVKDMLIVDVCDKAVLDNLSPYVLVVSGHDSGKNLNNRQLENISDLKFFIRKMVVSSGETYFEPANPKYAPIKLTVSDAENQEKAGYFAFVAGVVIQRISTYVL